MSLWRDHQTKLFPSSTAGNSVSNFWAAESVMQSPGHRHGHGHTKAGLKSQPQISPSNSLKNQNDSAYKAFVPRSRWAHTPASHSLSWILQILKNSKSLTALPKKQQHRAYRLVASELSTSSPQVFLPMLLHIPPGSSGNLILLKLLKSRLFVNFHSFFPLSSPLWNIIPQSVQSHLSPLRLQICSTQFWVVPNPFHETLSSLLLLSSPVNPLEFSSPHSQYISSKPSVTAHFSTNLHLVYKSLLFIILASRLRVLFYFLPLKG